MKALDYLRISAPIADAQDNQELSVFTKVVKEIEKLQGTEDAPLVV